jgi:hypothetical protein
VFHGQDIPTHHLGILLETSPAEAMAFLVSKVWLLAGLLVGVLGWLGAGWLGRLRQRDHEEEFPQGDCTREAHTTGVKNPGIE